MAFISEKQKCNFYNVGYCRKWDKGCKFIHPAESCQSESCEIRSCPKRHQRECKYFKHESSCKRGSTCQFKHKKKKKDNLDEEKRVLQKDIKEKNQTNKDLESAHASDDEQVKSLIIKLKNEQKMNQILQGKVKRSRR